MKDTRPINEQVAELTQEQKNTILKVFKGHLCFSIIMVVLLFAFLVCFFVFNSSDSEQAFDNYINAKNEHDIIQEQCDAKKEEIKSLETEISILQLKAFPISTTIDAAGNVVPIKRTEEEKREISEAQKELLALHDEMLVLLDEGKELKEKLDEKKGLLIAASEKYDEEAEASGDILNKSKVIFLIVFVVYFIIILLVQLYITKKYPYYSEKKYKYIKKMM